MANRGMFQALFIPALIAAVIYLILSYAVIPLFRRHHQRYAQYLPLDTLSERTSSFRARAQAALVRFVLPRSMRWGREVVDARRSSDSAEELAFGEEEGESMVGFDNPNHLARSREERAGGAEMDSERRLSRDLEEGFKDDSDDEDDQGGDERRR